MTATKAKLAAAIALGGALTALVLPAAAGAATITPSILTDEDAANADCSLREAVTAANTDGDYNGCNPGGADDVADTIVLQSGSTYSLGGAGLNGPDDANATGDLDVLGESLTIQSSGSAQATIDANGGTTLDRAIHSPFTSPTLITLTNLEITDGNDANGAGGGAVFTSGGLILTDSTLRANTSTNGAATAVRISGGGGSITDTSIHSNVGNAGADAAIFHESGNLTISGSLISGNSTASPAGGGGGLMKTNSSTLTLTNTTVSGNSTGGDGGGLALYGGTTNLVNSTITGNTADSDSPATANGDGGGVWVAGTATVNARNTIIANNVDVSDGDGPDCRGAITSQGYNLIESTTGCTGTTGSDITGQDPMLDALDDNGGPTDVHALLAGSPAINAGNPSTPNGVSPACEAADQRGQPRGGAALACDIGAFEAQPPVLDPIGGKSVQAGQNLTFTLTVTHPDPFDVLTFAASNLPPGAAFDPGTRTFSWTPGAAQVGSFPGVGFSVDDGTYDDSESIAITVTAPPPPGGGDPPPTTTKKKCKKGQKRKKGKCVKKKRKKRK